jgi:hypothetical protein
MISLQAQSFLGRYAIWHEDKTIAESRSPCSFGSGSTIQRAGLLAPMMYPPDGGAPRLIPIQVCLNRYWTSCLA